MNSAEFNELLWNFYAKNARDSLPWRKSESDGSFDPYKILVSEIMLQQTQVARVIDKYNQWIRIFPTVQILAEAPLSSVLTEWLGLGYNRRAKFLHTAAKQLVSLGEFPNNLEDLIRLPGVGANTAGAILAYAYNQPVVFVETNIRTVFLYHYFPDKEGVTDRELLAIIDESIDREHPREWYWALMDYGSHIKQTKGNFSKNSRHHTVQSKFEGSKRQVRGQVLKVLSKCGQQTLVELKQAIGDDRLSEVLEDLHDEGLVTEKHGSFSVAD